METEIGICPKTITKSPDHDNFNVFPVNVERKKYFWFHLQQNIGTFLTINLLETAHLAVICRTSTTVMDKIFRKNFHFMLNSAINSFLNTQLGFYISKIFMARSSLLVWPNKEILYCSDFSAFGIHILYTSVKGQISLLLKQLNQTFNCFNSKHLNILKLIIILRFTCGERDIWQNAKKSQNIVPTIVHVLSIPACYRDTDHCLWHWFWN